MRTAWWLPIVVVLAVASGCAASPPPAPPEPSAPTLSPAEDLAWHWVGALCSAPKADRAELTNLGTRAAYTQGELTSTFAQREQDKQSAAQSPTTWSRPCTATRPKSPPRRPARRVIGWSRPTGSWRTR
ncbi:hypothetical protein AB0383_13585 [Amycolatopsis sp. NPDC051373]|uniref:hypothetical protein n=1 Tax=Amycolatopsis sp. NPDC051373 TaxID=3155801 RepID=UPI00344FACC4